MKETVWAEGVGAMTFTAFVGFLTFGYSGHELAAICFAGVCAVGVVAIVLSVGIVAFE